MFQSKVIPQVSALHIAAKVGNMEILQLLAPRADVNKEDQVSFRILSLLQSFLILLVLL